MGSEYAQATMQENGAGTSAPRNDFYGEQDSYLKMSGGVRDDVVAMILQYVGVYRVASSCHHHYRHGTYRLLGQEFTNSLHATCWNCINRVELLILFKKRDLVENSLRILRFPSITSTLTVSQFSYQ